MLKLCRYTACILLVIFQALWYMNHKILDISICIMIMLHKRNIKLDVFWNDLAYCIIWGERGRNITIYNSISNRYKLNYNNWGILYSIFKICR